MKMTLAGIVLLFCAASAGRADAFEAGQIRRGADRCANWLIGQYKVKEKIFGSGPDAGAPEQAAMVVKGICDSPRDFKEANGPYITEPLKAMLAHINDKNEIEGTALHQTEAILWVITALKATNNPAYQPVIEKLRAHAKELPPPPVPESKPEFLSPTVADRESMRNAIVAIHTVAESNVKEIELGGQKIKWAMTLGESLVKLQKPDGSFGNDIQTNALALYALNLCYKAPK